MMRWYWKALRKVEELHEYKAWWLLSECIRHKATRSWPLLDFHPFKPIKVELELKQSGLVAIGNWLSTWSKLWEPGLERMGGGFRGEQGELASAERVVCLNFEGAPGVVVRVPSCAWSGAQLGLKTRGRSLGRGFGVPGWRVSSWKRWLTLSTLSAHLSPSFHVFSSWSKFLPWQHSMLSIGRNRSFLMTFGNYIYMPSGLG